MIEMKFTGERLVPSLLNRHGVTEHLHRYALAIEIVKNKIVLDIASGEGYGSNLLSDYALKVYGVDIDKESVEHAQRKYVNENKTNLKFLIGSTSVIPLEDESVDVVISFETIEHHNEHEQMMKEIKRVLQKNGTLLISSPERSIYKERDPNNPFHIKELNFNEFRSLIEVHFKHSFFFTQRFVAGSLIQGETSSSFKTYQGNYNEIQTGLNIEEVPFYNRPYFNMAICSDEEVNDLSFASFFDGAGVLRSEVNDIKMKFIKSPEYRLGKAVLRKFPFLKKFLQRRSL